MIMKKYRCLFLDLDGCIYRGNKLIPGAKEALERFREKSLQILFITNNSSLTSEGYCRKLRGLNIEARPEEVLTSGEATSLYILRESGQSNVLPITEKGFKEYCRRMGHTIIKINEWWKASYVVVGIDRRFNYVKLRAAYKAIMNGSRFVATNTDPVIPSEEGFEPGAGSIAAAISKAVGREPIVIGKPSRIIMEIALQKVSFNPSEVLVVGDRLDTDILAGKVIGADTALLLSGVTTKEDLEKIPLANRPDYVCENLLELYRLLETRSLI